MPKHTEEEAAMPLDAAGSPPEDAGKSPDIIDEFNLDDYRVDESLLVAATRQQVTVPVGKPKGIFFRVKKDENMIVPLYKDSDGRYLLVIAAVANDELMMTHVFPHKVEIWIDRSGNLGLWPLRQPRLGETSFPAWESAAVIIEAAKHTWLRFQWNKAVNGYDRYDAPHQPPEPTWPVTAIGDLIKVAFVGRTITSLDHPVVQQLLGRV